MPGRLCQFSISRTRAALRIGVMATLVASCTRGELPTQPKHGEVFVVGPGGGTFAAFAGALTLGVPQGAIAREVAITVDTSTTAPGGAVLIGPAYELGPNGTEFSQPVNLTIRYDKQQLPAGVQEADLLLATVQSGSWIAVGGADDEITLPDEPDNTLTAQITHFTTFAVVAPAPSPGTITLANPWAPGQFWVPATYLGHVKSAKESWSKGVDFYYAKAQSAGSFDGTDGVANFDLDATVGKAVLAPHAGTAKDIVRTVSPSCDASWVPLNRRTKFKQHDLLITATDGPGTLTTE